MSNEIAAQALQWWQDYPGWLIGIVATAGTALGTLALAFYTYRLAKSTTKSVEGAEDELAEVRAQRELLVEQADASREQARATGDLVTAFKSNSDQSYMARIDAYAPLVNMDVSVVSSEYLADRSAGPSLLPNTQLSISSDPTPVRVTLQFDFKNYGRSPALLFFGGEAAQMAGVAQSGSKRVALAPGEEYTDTLAVIESVTAFSEPKIQRIKVTYGGLLHGEVFDTIAWNGWVQPFRVSGETAVVCGLHDMLNASEAQIIREYPNLERPDEMANVRARLLGQEAVVSGDTQAR